MKLYKACMGYDYTETHSALFTSYEEALVWIRAASDDMRYGDYVIIHTLNTLTKEPSGQLAYLSSHILKDRYGRFS